MKNLRKLKTLETNAPEAMKAFSAFDKAAMSGDAIPRKYKEPMKLAAAFTTQRPYCIEIHAGKARKTVATVGSTAGRLFASDCPYFDSKDASPLVC
ncbi:MAG TPA: carboxymuconolactone decarboxylase family protein [Candidatus Acidoferrales bacterium]|nr:carboxymuconolactone decarboxylase family protein [Candidatus Acidoferrales bacterium]